MKNKTITNSSPKESGGLENKLIFVFSLVAAAFHLYTGGFGTLTQYLQVGIHWTMIGSLLVIANKQKFGFSKLKHEYIFRYLLAAVICFIAIYQIFLRAQLASNPGIFNQMDIIVGALAVVVALYLGFKFLGPVLPLICIIFILYTYFGRHISGVLGAPKVSFKRLVTQLYTGSDGMFGQTLMVPARFMLLYVFFGRMMDMSGTGQFLVDVVGSLTKRIRGGSAQAAVYSSMLMGMVSGSGHANVATTGVFTIPLMKKSGYSAKTAGAVEAVASSGGQIMPPVMGASAFLMAEITGISYSKIALSALIPACLYYICLSSALYSTTRVLNIPKPEETDMRPLKEVLREGWFHIIPIATIFGLIFTGSSPQRAVFWAICSAFAVMLIFNRKAFSVKKLLSVAASTAVSTGPMALTCMLAGIVMCTINLSGFGLNITNIIALIAGSNLMITLILAMLLCLILGMGMPTSACYILLSMLIVPAITRLGVPVMAAHLFVIYFGSLSSITPPVALSALTAANISGAGLWETGFEACKLALAGFIVPIVFVYNSELLLIGSVTNIVIAIVTAILGSIVLGQGTGGWSFVNMPLVFRILLCVAAVLLFIANPLISLAGLALAAMTVIVAKLYQKRKSLA